jgi:hypothetical protein
VSSTYWVGYTDGQISKRSNAGVWSDVDDNGIGVPDRWITDIAVNPQNDSEVFVTLAGYPNASDPVDVIWYSDDGGQSWSNRSGTTPNGLPPIQANTVVFHPADPSWIYVGTDLGVFSSGDRGQTWSVTPLNAGHDGPANVEISDLFFYGDEYMVAATHGRGMYRTRPLPIVYVDAAQGGAGNGSQSDPFATVAEAEAFREEGASLSIRSGTYVEGALTISKRGAVAATNGVVTIQ